MQGLRTMEATGAPERQGEVNCTPPLSEGDGGKEGGEGKKERERGRDGWTEGWREGQACRM